MKILFSVLIIIIIINGICFDSIMNVSPCVKNVSTYIFNYNSDTDAQNVFFKYINCTFVVGT